MPRLYRRPHSRFLPASEALARPVLLFPHYNPVNGEAEMDKEELKQSALALALSRPDACQVAEHLLEKLLAEPKEAEPTTEYPEELKGLRFVHRKSAEAIHDQQDRDLMEILLHHKRMEKRRK